LIANSEKGKLFAKKSFCHTSVSKAATQLQGTENGFINSESTQKSSSLLKALDNLSKILE